MPHLSLEELARLLDEPPTDAERAHLKECTLCREELDALRGDRTALGELPDFLPPPAGAWTKLEDRLREEGLILAAPRAPRLVARRLLHLAAALAIFLLGGIAGFGVRGLGQAAEPAASESDAIAAARALQEAEAAYHAALTRYAELVADPVAADPIARLELLDNIVSSTRAALTTAPADPLINGYHLTALAQRDAAVRQLVSASDDRWY